jgi:hypothetical protein
MSNLALAIISIPSTTVNLERLFSQLKLIKTDRRNRLKENTLESLLIMK